MMPPFQLSYDAPPECPNQAAFEEGVRSRLPAASQEQAGEAVIAIDVRVTRGADGYRAIVEVPAANGRRATRTVSGKSCENVVRGSALVTALALEARVADDAPSESASAEPAPTSPPSPPSPAPPPASRPAPVRPVTAIAPSPPKERATSEPATFEILLGVRGSSTAGVAPGVAFGLGVFAGVRYRALGVALGIESARSGRVRSEGVPAEYSLDCARLEAGLSLALSPPLELEGLVSFEGGVLGAEALPDPPIVVDGTHGSAAWWAPGVAGRLRVSARPVFVSAEVFGRAPLVRERFFVDIDGERRVAHTVPYFSVGGALMAGARF
jgi:hypothetical protein